MKPSATKESKPLWGLTGGIAAGKSTSARIFAEQGIPVIDADRIAREVSSEGGAAHLAILQRFGTADRAQLRERVFADPRARADLEAILHPMIQQESRRQVEALPDGPVIYEAALLVETGRYRELAGLIVVDAPRELRRQRLMTREGMTLSLAEKILGAQISDEKRREVATEIIENADTVDALREKIVAFVQRHRWK